MSMGEVITNLTQALPGQWNVIALSLSIEGLLAYQSLLNLCPCTGDTTMYRREPPSPHYTAVQLKINRWSYVKATVLRGRWSAGEVCS